MKRAKNIRRMRIGDKDYEAEFIRRNMGFRFTDPFKEGGIKVIKRFKPRKGTRTYV